MYPLIRNSDTVLDLEHTVKMLIGILICSIIGTGMLVSIVSYADISDTLKTLFSIIPIVFMGSSIFMALNFVRLESERT